MKSKQAMASLEQKSKHVQKLRIIITIVGSLVIIAGVFFTLLLPSKGSVIVTALGLIITFVTWVWPLPSHTQNIPEHSHSSTVIPLHVPVTPQQLTAPSATPTLEETGSLQQTRQPIWNIPYLRNPFFTGREDILKQIHDNLVVSKSTALTQRQAISGLGGIGKTQIAIEYAYRHREEYNVVLWVNAATRESIIASFPEIATLLDLPQKQEADQNFIIMAVKQWLNAHQHWLLIFDNADDLALIEEFLPANDAGHLLLTTRDQAQGALAHGLPVDIMNMEEATLLFLRRAKLLAVNSSLEQTSPEIRTQSESIVQVMDGLPLALDQAAAYIEETGCSLSAYLPQYQHRQAHFLGRRGKTGKDHPYSVVTTWSLSFSQIQRTNQLAADLLCICAFLAPDAIPEEVLIAGAAELGPTLATLKDDPTQLDEAIGVLRRFSLLRRHTEEQTLSIHRLVQAVLQLDTSIRTLWLERVVRAVNAAFPNITVTTRHQCERVLPHALQCARFIETFALIFPESAQLLDQTGSYLKERGPYKEAEPLLRRALTIREQILGPSHPDTAQSLNNLAELCYCQGLYGEAELFFQRALTIKEQVLGPNHPSTARSLNSLAVLYRNQGKDEKAEPLYKRALTIREQVLGLQHPDTAQSLDNLAIFYYGRGKYKEAEPLYQQALSIREQVLGASHPDTAQSLNSLASLYRSLGKNEEAEALFRRALTIREQVLGANHPDTAQSLNNLAEFCYSQGKDEEAEALFQRALTIKEQVLGPNHPSTARSLNSLAVLYRNQGKDEKAEPLLRRALAIREQILGSDHPETAQSLNNLAEFYVSQGQEEEAEALFRRALTIREHMLGPDHPSTARTLTNLAELYERQGKYMEAEALFRRALTIREHMLGPDHPNTQQVREKYTKLQQNMKAM